MDRNYKMEIERKVSFMIIILIFMLFACRDMGKNPEISDIIGLWKGPDGSQLIFEKNGNFSGKRIPAYFGFFPEDSFKNVKFDGSGNWKLREGKSFTQIYLEFEKVSSEVDSNGCTFPIYIAGQNGLLENKPPWYLFEWQNEIGGERFKWIKQ